MIYLGQNAVSITTKIPVYEIYQSITTPVSNSQTIVFNIEHKPDAFIVGAMDMAGTIPGGIYGCTAACAIWSEYQNGQYTGGRATGRNSSNAEDHWGITSSNITYDASNNTLTIFTNSPVWFIADRTYRLSYYVSHREVTPNA